MPPNTVSVARPTKWGNPYRIGRDHTYYGGPGYEQATPKQCVLLYRWHLSAWASAERVSRRKLLQELRGKNLACWCPLDQPCHADALLELANPPRYNLNAAWP